MSTTTTGAGLIKIPYRKSTLCLTFSEFSDAIERGKAILRRSKQAAREQKAQPAADRKRDERLGFPG